MSLKGNNYANKLKMLEKAKEDIKGRLVNCGEQIDQFANMISSWFITPELLTRPTVINIFGPTGTGKTQMIREFVKELKLGSLFSSICINSSEGGSVGYRIDNAISSLNLNSVSDSFAPEGIIFLDEFQNFIMKDIVGQRKTSDGKIWEILSSGKVIEQLERTDIISMYNEIKRCMTSSHVRMGGPAEPQYAWHSIYGAARYKRILKIAKKVEDIMVMTPKEMLPFVERLKDNFTEVVLETDYSKCVFIICANLDSVFDLDPSARVDVDADVVHESCKHITVFDIKRGLSSFLFDEQLARLGNNFIVFYTINKKGFRTIIATELERVKEDVKRVSNIDITFDKSIYRTIYRNGVFPTQGARCVFSTIASMISNMIPKILFDSRSEEPTSLTLSYDPASFSLVTDDGKKYKVLGPVDEATIRIMNNPNERRCTSVHEAGHAIVYAELFGAVPNAIVSVVADSYVGAGYITTHQIRHTRATMTNFITTAVAGMVAEELVFGKDYRTVGCSSDLVTATVMASRFIRRFAFSEKIKAVVGHDESFYNNVGGTSEAINEMVVASIKKASDIITSNISLLKDVSERLYQKNSLTPDEFSSISKEHSKNYAILEFGAKIIPNFDEKYAAFKNSGVANIEDLAEESVKALESFYPRVSPQEKEYSKTNDFNATDFNDNWTKII